MLEKREVVTQGELKISSETPSKHNILQKKEKTQFEYVVVTETPSEKKNEPKTYFEYEVVTEAPSVTKKEPITYLEYVVVTESRNLKPSKTKNPKTEITYVVVTESSKPKPLQMNNPKTEIEYVVVTETPKVSSKKTPKTIVYQEIVTYDPKLEKSNTQEVHVIATETPKKSKTLKTHTLVKTVAITEQKPSKTIDDSTKKHSVATKTKILTTVIQQDTHTRDVATETSQLPAPLIRPDDPLVSGMYNYDGPYSLNKTFQEEMLLDHNTKRARHGVGPLKWSSECFNFASGYASQYDCSGKLKHSGEKFGENLAYGYSPLGAMNAWYVEGEEYVYGTEKIYNHFTAIVWNRTTEMACASRSCERGFYIICSYDPPGNVIGYSTRNVFPPLY
ncbi:hypothetical protein JA1_002095 [Spathaspora sp. JA1]|nr:hypothetical protein JA1_002095 [Spathaspora sp. JA1]